MTLVNIHHNGHDQLHRLAHGREVEYDGIGCNPKCKLCQHVSRKQVMVDKSEPVLRAYNLVEAHCYGIGRTGQLLSNHVAVETDGNVRRFNREGLHQLQYCIVTGEDLRGRNVLHFHLFLLLRD